MFKLINSETGVEVGNTERPRFIKKSSAGCYIQATEEEAQGVALRGTPYNLAEREGVGAPETVYLMETDGGEDYDAQRNAMTDVNETLDDILVQMLEGEG